jgi:hypothetical protein
MTRRKPSHPKRIADFTVGCAKERVERILKDHHPEPVENNGIAADIEAFLERTAKEHGN